MFALLSPRLWIAVAIAAALAFSHFFVYRAGRNHVRLQWQAAISQANIEARALEQRRQDRADEAAKLAVTRANSNRAAAARIADADGGLRIALDTAERVAQESHDAARLATSTLRGLFDACRAEYRAVAEEAAGHANDSLTYQQAWPK